MSRINLNTNSLWEIGVLIENIQKNARHLCTQLTQRVHSLTIIEDVLQRSDEKIEAEVHRIKSQADRCGFAASYIFKIAESYELNERIITENLSVLAKAITDVSNDNKMLYDKNTVENPVTYNTTTIKITESGQIVDSFNGVPAVYVKESSNEGTYCCARYVSKYYEKVYGVKVSNMFTGATPIVNKGSISETQTPQVGDIGYQTNSSGHGHWFIVKGVNNDGTYTVIEQNWKFNKNGDVYCTVNRQVSYASTKGLKFYRWSEL